MLVLNFYFFDIFEVQPEQRQFCITIKLKHAAAIVKYAAAITKHAASIDRSVMFGMARQPVGPLRSCKGEEMNPMALRACGTSQRGSHRTWWGCPGPAPAVSRAPEDLPRLHPTRHFSRCFSFRNQCPPPSHRPIISKWDGLAVEMYQFGRNRLARARRLLLKLGSLCRPKV